MRFTKMGVGRLAVGAFALALAACGPTSSGSSTPASVNTSAAASAASSAGAAVQTALVGFAATNEGKNVSNKIASCMPAGYYEDIITPADHLSVRIKAGQWLLHGSNRTKSLYPCLKQDFHMTAQQHTAWTSCIEDQAGKPAFRKQLRTSPGKLIGVIAGFLQNQFVNCYGVATGIPDAMGTSSPSPTTSSPVTPSKSATASASSATASP
jgi:hypothetical protein